MHQPQSLQNSSVEACCKALRISSPPLEETLKLPIDLKKQLRSQIKNCWVRSEPGQDPNTFPYEAIKLDEMTREEFTMMLNIPDSVELSWMNERVVPDTGLVHVRLMYWRFTMAMKQTTRCICYKCYIKYALMNEHVARQLFGEDQTQWFFSPVVIFYSVSKFQFNEKVVRKAENYCDMCLTNPLFEILPVPQAREMAPIGSVAIVGM